MLLPHYQKFYFSLSAQIKVVQQKVETAEVHRLQLCTQPGQEGAAADLTTVNAYIRLAWGRKQAWKPLPKAAHSPTV